MTGRSPAEPDWGGLVAAVQRVDPLVAASTVIAAARRAAVRPAHQHVLVAAVVDDPAVLRGEGNAAAAMWAVRRLVEALLEAGVDGVAQPGCPRCGRVVQLQKWHAGTRICPRCDEQLRAAPCSRCGVVRAVNGRDGEGRPVCGGCRRRDPDRAARCARCGRVRPVSARAEDGPRCSSCAPLTVAVCGLCGRTAPGKRSALTGQHRCRTCTSRPRRCSGCGQVLTVHSGTLADPRCADCTAPSREVSPRRWHRCPRCGQRNTADGSCSRCRLQSLAQDLLAVDGQVRPQLQPLLDWWRMADRPDLVRSWLAGRSASRALLQSLADGTVPISHAGLDEVGDTQPVQYMRGVLVAAGALPARDEHLHRLERWLLDTVAAVRDPDDRSIVHRYAHWHLLRRLRARTGPQRPATAGQADRLRGQVTAAIAVLRTVRAAGTSLATLTDTEVTGWLADRPIARPTSVGAFLRWARQQRLCAVAPAVPQWAGPRGRIDHDQRWDQARRLLHDDALPLQDRVAGLLVVLYAQTASSVSVLRCDQIQPTSGGAHLTFGATPIDLPPTVVVLVNALLARRAGTERTASPWLFPGRPGTQPITAGRLQGRLAAIGVPARQARTAALFQLAVELPAGVLARCLGMDVSSAVAWQRAASGDWHRYAARVAEQSGAGVDPVPGGHRLG